MWKKKTIKRVMFKHGSKPNEVFCFADVRYFLVVEHSSPLGYWFLLPDHTASLIKLASWVMTDCNRNTAWSSSMKNYIRNGPNTLYSWIRDLTRKVMAWRPGIMLLRKSFITDTMHSRDPFLQPSVFSDTLMVAMQLKTTTQFSQTCVAFFQANIQQFADSPFQKLPF